MGYKLDELDFSPWTSLGFLNVTLANDQVTQFPFLSNFDCKIMFP